MKKSVAITVSILCILSLFQIVPVYAQGTYVKLEAGEEGSIKKQTVGNHQFEFKEEWIEKQNAYKGTLKVTSTQSGKSVMTIEGHLVGVFTDGEKIYYEEDWSIKEAILKTKKTRVLKTISKENSSYNIEKIINDKIFFHVRNFDDGGTLYKLFPKDKTMVMISERDKAGSCQFAKNRILYRKLSESAVPCPLYSVDYNGKNEKKLSDNVLDFSLHGTKVYYSQAIVKEDGSYYSRVYSSDSDGRNKKAMTGSIQGMVLEITPKYAVYLENAQTKNEYRIYFSDGRKEKVERK